jgi:hypothetical protein
VKAHGGEIKVETEEREGAEFIVILTVPQCKRKPQDKNQPQFTPAQSKGAGTLTFRPGIKTPEKAMRGAGTCFFAHTIRRGLASVPTLRTGQG